MAFYNINLVVASEPPPPSAPRAITHKSRAPATPIVGGRGDDKFRFTVLRDGLVRYEYAPDGHFEDRPSAFAALRDEALQSAAVPDFTVRETSARVEIITERFHLTYSKAAGRFSPGTLFARVFGHTDDVWRFGEEQQTLGGTYRTLDHVDGRVDMGHGVVSRKGFASVDDSRTMLFTPDGSFIAPRREPVEDRIDGYLFCYGHDYRAAVRALYAISGPQPLLPRWALGNWWSRYKEYTTESYLELVRLFRRNRLPLSCAVIDMDWHLVRDDVVKQARQSGWTGYTWNKALFPDPKAFIKELHHQGLKVTVNDHPAEGVACYEDMYEAVARKLNMDASTKETIPFDITDKNFLEAYFDPLLKHIEDDGVDFWWIDWQQGRYTDMRDVDPLWVLNHYHYQHNAKRLAQRQRSSSAEHPLIFSRYAGPGSHRYPVGFSGDTIVSWASLEFQPEFTATASNIGYGWWSHDIGGHMLGERDDELTARWVQFGVFSPIMRLHSTKNEWMCKEPWKLPAGSGQGPQDTVFNFLRLRHRLIPYIHTMNARAAHKEHGEPLVQPMYWEHPERDEAYSVPNQYYFGTEMIVAPITSPLNRVTKTGKVRAWLPPGKYVDYFTGVAYDGNRHLWFNRTLDKCPVLLKQGAIVPLERAEAPENGGKNPDRFEIVVAVGADGQFELLEEDEEGITIAREATEWPDWIRTPIVFKQAEGTITIGPTTGGHPGLRRNWSVRVPSVKVTGPVTASYTGEGPEPLVSVVNSAVHVELRDVPPRSQAVIHLGANPQVAVNKPAMELLFPILYKAQVGYELKEKIEAIVEDEGASTAARASQLDTLDMDPDLRLVVNEILFAKSSA
ncbi:hypothetical protein JDV02_000651 [Purpureocillium takamizusanense]|uniref:Glycoside hydrolase family 31 protein n=1 Tax=Purpureocillium takamizusanense TaxID=2060973 RepID=A0A9Q8Q6I4_9HYPO|nr:uncharacterized protein JDV02_000651 [Purpureocillium takamizusanense]UNI13965.1 hypothetical protein JDV02_000651 [Purpureocillium takamizusanense]